MQQDYYREYYIYEREHWWFRARAEILAQKIRAWIGGGKRPRILNVGAALGASSDLLSRFGNVVSVEYDPDCCVFITRNGLKRVVNASITDLPFPADSFDLVCAFDVIEHVADDDRAVGELKRVCRPGGAIMVTVPAFMALWSHHDEVNRHHRRYRLSGLRRLFARDGRILNATYFNTLLFPVVLLVRMGTRLVPQKWIRKGAGSDFSLVNSGIIDQICYTILKSEGAWLEGGRALPFGVSAFVSWQKS